MSARAIIALGAALFAAACGSSKKNEPIEIASARGTTFELGAASPPPGYDPFALAKKALGHASNEEASTPSDCYAKANGDANTCVSCHTRSAAPNFADDWELQQNYSFTEYAKTNRWKNLFRERTEKVAAFTDDAVLAHVRQDNYGPLLAWLDAHPESPGFKPDLDLARGFDADGFANDGSGWRAVRYKPFTGNLTATTGSTGDVFVRLPAAFRTSPAIYRANLAILEATITADPMKKQLSELSREVEAIDETAVGFDLDGDGALGIATRVIGLPSHFAGGASTIAVVRGLYPAGTEFLHTVRYLDPERPGLMATRMKEVRYAKKTEFLTEREIAHAYMAIEEPDGALYTGDALTGLTNGFSWQLHGYIEDASGWLRKQTDEEHAYCMGCHSNVGVTVDQTFAFARKVPGTTGWRPQDPTGIPDVPQAGHTIGELAEYQLRAGAREPLDATRAIALDRAYLANVMEQSYVWGRDAKTSPANNMVAQVGRDRSTGLGEADRVYRDARLQLDWSARTAGMAAVRHDR